MNRVLGHFCDFFLEKWSKIGVFLWFRTDVLGHFCDFFLEKWVKIEHFSGSERLWWDTFAIFCWCDKMLFLS